MKKLDVNDINNENIFIAVLVLCLEDIDNEFVWKGKYIGAGEFITVSGTDCFALQPTVKNVDGSMRFCFDKQFILDLNVGIAGQDNAELLGRKKQNQEAKKDTLFKCFVCHNNIDINIMRVHVGKHILKKDVIGVNVCGFCGQSSCSNNL